MVFGFIGFDGFLSIRKIEGNLTGIKYATLLKDEVLPMLNSRYGSNLVFQQDNARPHIQKDVMKLFKVNEIKRMEWPPYSPDLSIIENVWRLMKDKVYDGYQFKNKKDLWITIQEDAEIINFESPSRIKLVYENITDRLLNVIENHGEN